MPAHPPTPTREVRSMQYLKQFSYGRRLLFFLSNSMCGVRSMSVCAVDVLQRDHTEQWQHLLGCQAAAMSWPRGVVSPAGGGAAPPHASGPGQVLPAELSLVQWGLCPVTSLGVGSKDSLCSCCSPCVHGLVMVFSGVSVLWGLWELLI